MPKRRKQIITSIKHSNFLLTEIDLQRAVYNRRKELESKRVKQIINK